ncbi:Segment polarity protein dishevelled-like DVL-3 [Acipenser ruthenus]|uniref:Segment polarity protein dishevelled-like DVL-3 n=1 Tax=Acipenser ruthenus TaxID=7906 RepID=A0A444U257_ACIRT|nr:Segment polarity protein dishevelled-like DVL-3 [Acipenser ruthenus]
MGETKIIYHIDDQETPYLVKLHIPADRVTLADFKNVLNKPNYKFFFKSMDDDFGWVQQQFQTIVSQAVTGSSLSHILVSADGSHSDGGSVCADSQSDLPPPIERTGGIGDSRPPSFQLYCENYYPPRRPGESSLVCLAFNISSELLSECGQLWYGRSLRDQNREPIRPIDPAAWVSHTAAMTGTYPVYGMSPSMSTITSTSSSITSSIPETERFDDFHLSIHSDMATIAKAMASPESGLEVRDRMWLKITIPNAFIGSDVVDWLYHHVEGFTDRREARKYASNLLKAGYIRHTVNKITFSEQCYYIFGDLCGNMANLSLNDHDGSSGTSDQDTLAPLPHPGAAPWPLAFPYQYPAPHPYNPPTGFHDPGYNHGGGGGSAGSQHSEGSRSSGSNRSGSEQRRKEETAAKASGGGGGGGGGDSKSGGSGSESDHTTRSSSSMRRERAPSERSAAPPSEHSLRSHHSAAHSLRSNHSHAYVPPPHFPPPLVMMGPPGAPPGRDLASVPPELTASRQSFRMAMGNPSEFFVDVM